MVQTSDLGKVQWISFHVVLGGGEVNTDFTDDNEQIEVEFWLG